MRSLVAVVVGFAAMAAAVIVATMVLGPLPGMAAAGGGASNLWLVVNLTYSLLAAMLGGWLAAHLAPRRRFEHGAAIAAFVAVSYLFGGGAAQPGQPAWYPLVITAVGIVGLLAGSYRRSQRP
jgi:hypothetical protein